ncbi:MAG: hypothetical protein Q8R53_01045 [Nanoarchaeota archaeon]|nr:hypothetical protein [Nanoarchaeota archaeon]
MYPCVAANFFFDEKTGEIVYFGNLQHVPRQIREKYAEGTFRLAIDWMKSGKLSIVNLYLWRSCPGEARYSLEETVRLYNEQYGFSLSEPILEQ